MHCEMPVHFFYLFATQTLSTFRDCGLLCSNFLFACVSVMLLEKFARKGRRNFTRINLTSAVVCATLSFLSHLNRGFLMTDGSTAHVNFCSGCGRLMSKAAAREAANSRRLTKPTKAMLGYDSPPLSMPAIMAVVVECDLGDSSFMMHPSHIMLSRTARTRNPAIRARVLDRRLCCGGSGKNICKHKITARSQQYI